MNREWIIGQSILFTSLLDDHWPSSLFLSREVAKIDSKVDENYQMRLKINCLVIMIKESIAQLYYLIIKLTIYEFFKIILILRPRFPLSYEYMPFDWSRRSTLSKTHKKSLYSFIEWFWARFNSTFWNSFAGYQ